MLSVVVPIYNEDENLHVFLERLQNVLEQNYKDFEIIAVNDGSQDNSLSFLLSHQETCPFLKVIDFQRNFGQHMAIIAGFEHACGEVIITIDADLQNPPEAIPMLVNKMREGYDYVGTYRMDRKDSPFRTGCSKLINCVRHRFSNVRMRDQGCMLRAYSKKICQSITACKDPCTFIPALAFQFCINPCEIPIPHEKRMAGESKYNFYRLFRLNFDLVTGLSMAPLQIFTILGGSLSIISFLFVIYLFIRRLVIGPEAEGLFTLFAILFLLISVLMMGVGILGEYIGRIFLNVSQKPHYVVRKIYDYKKPDVVTIYQNEQGN